MVRFPKPSRGPPPTSGNLPSGVAGCGIADAANGRAAPIEGVDPLQLNHRFGAVNSLKTLSIRDLAELHWMHRAALSLERGILQNRQELISDGGSLQTPDVLELMQRTAKFERVGIRMLNIFFCQCQNRILVLLRDCSFHTRRIVPHSGRALRFNLITDLLRDCSPIQRNIRRQAVAFRPCEQRNKIDAMPAIVALTPFPIQSVGGNCCLQAFWIAVLDKQLLIGAPYQAPDLRTFHWVVGIILRHKIQGGQCLQNPPLVEQRLTPLSPNNGVLSAGHAEQTSCVLEFGELALAPD